MKKLIHLAAIWLIAMILPMQSFATAITISCDKPQSQQTVESGRGHCHEHTSAAVDTHAHHKQANTKHACKHCSKCSACCSGFTFAASTPSLTHQFQVEDADVEFISSAFNSHIPSGPERPPRLTLI